MRKAILTWLGGIVSAVIASMIIWWLTTDQPEPEPPGAKAGLFAGSWVNENTSTSGITRVEIRQRLNNLLVHTWGKCHPTDCDHGEKSVNVSDSDDGVFSIKKELSFAIKTMEYTILPDGRLRIVKHSHFTDSSGRPDFDSSDYFRKQ